MAERVLVEFVVDSSGAVRAVQTLKGQLDTELPRAASTASSSIGAMQVALGQLAAQLASAAFRGMTDFFRNSITAAAEEERVMQRLASTVEAAGVSWSTASGSVQALLSGIQDTTRFADDEAAAAFQTLIGITGDYNSSLTGLNAAVTLAAGRNMDLETAAQLLGKAIAGNTQSLGRYGIVLTESEKAMLKNADATERAEFYAGKFNERYGDAAQADFRTAAGQIDYLSNQFDDLKEAVGGAINRNLFDPEVVRPLVEMIKFLKSNVDTVVIVFQETIVVIELLTAKATAAIARHLAWVASGVKRIIDELASLVPGVGTMFEGAGDWVGFFSNAALDAEGAAEQLGERLGDLDAKLASLKAKAKETAEAVGTNPGGLGDSFLKATEESKKFLQEVERHPVGLYALVRSQETLNQQILNSGRSYISASNDGRRYLTFLDDYAAKFGIIGGMPTNFPSDVSNSMRQVQDILMFHWQELSAQMGETLRAGLADGLIAAFSGDTEGLLDAFSSTVDQMAQDAARGLVDALSVAFGPGVEGSFGQRLGSVFSGEGGGWQMAGSVVGGGMLAMGQQRGNQTVGAVGGAAGAAAAWGPAWGAGPWGIVGGIVATVIGGVMGYLSSAGQDSPETAFRLGPEGVTDLRSANQGLGDAQRESFSRRAQSAYRSVQNAYLNVIRTFEDLSLFGMLGELPSFATGGDASMQGGSADTWLSMLTSDILPDLFQAWASEALGAGLSGQGVSAGAQARLFEELGNTSGSERLQALQTFVSAVVNSSKLLADLDWEAMAGEVGASSLEQFGTYIADTLDQIDVAMSGMDQMDLVSRAQQAQSIEQLIGQAREAEIQYLGQIRQLQEDISRSIAAQIEGLQVGGMSQNEQAQYYAGRVQTIMGQLRGGQMSPEEVQQAVAQLQQYIQAMQGVAGEELYSMQYGGMETSSLAALLGVTGGETIADVLIGLLTEADTLAQSQLEGVADEVGAANDLLIAELDRLREALGITADSIFESYGTNVEKGGGSAIAMALASVPPPVVNVNISGNIAPLISLVQTVVQQTLAGNASATGVA